MWLSHLKSMKKLHSSDESSKILLYQGNYLKKLAQNWSFGELLSISLHYVVQHLQT